MKILSALAFNMELANQCNWSTVNETEGNVLTRSRERDDFGYSPDLPVNKMIGPGFNSLLQVTNLSCA